MIEYTAFVAAGRGRSSAKLQGSYDVANKCLIPIHGEPMLHRVLRALSGVAGVTSTTVICEAEDWASCPLSAHPEHLLHVRAPSPHGPGASLSQAVREYDIKAPLLITTGDNGLLTSQIVEEFLERVAARQEECGAALHIAVVSKDTMMQAYPETRRTWWNLSDYKISGCNLYAATSMEVIEALSCFDSIYRFRKKPGYALSLIGLSTVIAYLCGRVSIADAERRLSRWFGVPVCLIPLSFAQAAIDGDKREDIMLMEKILAQQHNAASDQE